MFEDFLEFLKEWGIVGLAVAVIIGGKLNEWVSALVSDIMMPLIGVLLPGGSWREFVLELPGEGELLIGHFLGATLDFIIIAFVIYFIFTRLFKSEQALKALEAKKTQ